MVTFVYMSILQISAISTQACEHGDAMTITCGEGEVMLIKKATYGRTEADSCPYSSLPTVECFGNVTADTEKVAEKCNNQHECVIPASNSLFGDPCRTIRKYLTVFHTCVSK